MAAIDGAAVRPDGAHPGDHRVPDLLADHHLGQGSRRDRDCAPVIVPTRFTLDNYRAALATPGVALAFVNSIVVAVASTILTTFLGSLAAYALAKTYLSFAFRQGLLVWILVTRIFRR